MTDRRSLGDAMEMTPAKLAFIKGQPDKEAYAATSEVSPPTGIVEKAIELRTPASGRVGPTEKRSKEIRRTTARSVHVTPEASEILAHMLVPVTIRLQRKTSQALKRAYLEQRLNHARPDTQQEIVEEALGDWLARRGFLE